MTAKKILQGGHYAIIGMITAIVFIVLFCSFPATASVSEKELEGYEVNFDSSDDYPEELEVAYQYYVKTAPNEMIKPKKGYIGIDLYDIDNDGKKEIICKVMGPAEAGYCGSAGCTFNIFKQTNERDKNGKPIYAPIRWDDPREGMTVEGLIITKIKILKSTTNGFHDLLFDNSTIWQWQGDYYDRVKDLED